MSSVFQKRYSVVVECKNLNTEITEALSTQNKMKYDNQDYPHQELTKRLIGMAIKIHKKLGPGFKEKYYQRAYYLELKRQGYGFEREKKVAITYNKALLGYHIVDFIIEGKIVLEIKAIKELNEVNVGQLTVYLRLAGCKVGLLLNFGQSKLAIKRVKV